METILQLQAITKHYGKIKALSNVTFEVPKGAVFGILGPNGSGKTTLLSIILDVLKADAGNFLWFGKPGSPDQRKMIGSLLETPNFYHYLSATNNLKVTQSISGRGNAQEIERVLTQVKLFERRDSRFSTYSLGMKQRLAIAAALLGNPTVLVFDEPTNGLDPVGIAEIRELIVQLRLSGHTVVMASHLLDEVEKICTHVAILKKGNLITSGSVDEVLLDEDILEIGASNLDQLLSLLGNYPRVGKISREGQYLQILLPKGEAKPDELNRFCFNEGIVLSHLAVKKKKLEVKFLELTNN